MIVRRIAVLVLLLVVAVFATPPWSRDDFERAAAGPYAPPVYQNEVQDRIRGEWQRWSYIHEMVQTARFEAIMQVSDTLDPNYGGIIEGEDQMTLVETDNTQQAIWVWCRYYEIFGDTVYFPNIRRAWIYVMNNPAYEQEGTESDYYRVWNCGLALFCETKYRAVSGDTSYGWYADSCVGYMYGHPLSFTVPDPMYRQLHPKTQALAAGMLYQYAKRTADPVQRDTALAYGQRVKTWIEADPDVNLNNETWAMSGGTCVWGLCRSIFDADTLAGQAWLATYLPRMKYFQPIGTWNNSWNIWYANAYIYAGRITGNAVYLGYHHGLTDSMLVQDYDDDGGVPPTRGWTQYQDHAWVSNYMFFMGFDGLLDSCRDRDAGVQAVAATGPRPFFLAGDTLRIWTVASNYGFLALDTVQINIRGPLNADTMISLGTGDEDTIRFPAVWIPADTGMVTLAGISIMTGDERPENDTIEKDVLIRPLRLVQGFIRDTANNRGVPARLLFQLYQDTGAVYFDSCRTDTAGNFQVHLIDSLYQVATWTDLPYPDFADSGIYITPDSISVLDYRLAPVDLLIINRDNLGRYASFYTIPLDSLAITSKVWTAVRQGVCPLSRIGEFNHPVIIWYSGAADVNTVTPLEQDSLTMFLAQGGRLLITGQNIGQELASTAFYRDVLHARFINPVTSNTRCYPDLADSLGAGMERLFTSGGASNQTSRDVIAADSFAHDFLYYDSTLTSGAGIWYRDFTTDYRTVTLGFGTEAVHKPASWTGYMSRKNFLAHILNWFGLTGIEERKEEASSTPMFTVYPNPSRGQLEIKLDPVARNDTKGMVFDIYDATGRFVRSLCFPGGLYPLHSSLKWDGDDRYGRRVPTGIYFIHMTDGTETKIEKVILLN